MTVLSPRPSKAQARWNLLRQAILSSAGSSSPASSSLPPHTGGIRTYTFHLPCPSTSSPLPLTIALQLITPSPPSTLSSACPLSSPLAALVSHRPENVGVDNTGNVRVWPAEEALLLLLLKKGLDRQTGIRRRPRRILELGAGCTGLLGLGLAMAWGGNSLNGGPSTPWAKVEVQRLVWKEEGEQEIKDCDMTQKCHRQLHDNHTDEKSHHQGCCEPFDLIVAADVLFFERFHRALLHTLHTHLHPEGGEAWFLQPSRGGSLERFIALVKEEGGWEVVWEGERGGMQTGGDDCDYVESAPLQLLKLRCTRQSDGGIDQSITYVAS
ncbi:hypothetical protein VYU27_009159 [Nannochloropsis oceanica]